MISGVISVNWGILVYVPVMYIVLAAVKLFQRYDLQGKNKIVNPWRVR